MIITLLSTSPVDLRLTILERFVANRLASVVLIRARPVFENSSISGFSSGVEEAFRQEPLRIGGFS